MRFEVHALNAQQEIVALTLEAANEAAARESARGKGLDVFAVRTQAFHFGIPRRQTFSALLFSRELKSLLEAGLNLVEALQTLAEKEAAGERTQVLSAIVAALHRGEPFSQALAGLPEVFPPLYVATVKATERTGGIAEALARYIAYQEELERVKKKVVSASIYPAILLGVGVLVLGFLMFYVVPRFAGVYEDMAGTLPFFSQLLLGFGRFVGNHMLLLGIGFASSIAALIWAFSQPGIPRLAQYAPVAHARPWAAA